MRFLRVLFSLSLLSLVAFGVAYFLAGRAEGPRITISQPSIVGRSGTLVASIETPGGRLVDWSVAVEQNGRTLPVLTHASAAEGDTKLAAADRFVITHAVGKEAIPDLEAGAATIVVRATRPVLWGFRQASSEAQHPIEVRLTPPRLTVASTLHYVNQGGSELVVYRVTPPEAASGVRVGEHIYPGFSAAEAGFGSDPSVRLAFFAVLHDQEPTVRPELFASDGVGNEARAPFDHRVFAKRFRQSRMTLDEAFIAKVVPAILQQSPELTWPTSSPEERLSTYLKINGEMRRANAATIAEFAAQTAPTMLWSGAFRQLSNSQVESGFADYRTYVYEKKEVDRQVHLGFDLATTANAPVEAAHRGRVLFAGTLGIYGNSVIVDHGLGVQSLYAHLSSVGVTVGQEVQQGQTLGLSGQTGLAGGDHLHFSMLVNGQFVNATEWWDPHWMEDRIVRKLREAGIHR